jgi:hypothetical protein
VVDYEENVEDVGKCGVNSTKLHKPKLRNHNETGCFISGVALYEILPAGKKNNATSAPPLTSG